MSSRHAHVLIFFAALAFYAATLAPTVQWGDFGGYQTRITLGELELAPQGHPLWNLLARPFTYLPFGDAAWRVNFSSAFFAALALVVLFAALRIATGSLAASLLATLALAVSHTFWTYAVMPKAYSLTLLLLALAIFWLLRWRKDRQAWRVAAVGFALGIGVMNHLIIITATPAVVLFIAWESARPRDKIGWRAGVAARALAVCGIAFAIGLVPYVWLLSTAPAASANTSGFVATYLLKFLELLGSPIELVTGIVLTVANLGYQFFLMTLVGAWGLWRMWRRDRAFAMLCLLVFLGDVAFVLIPTEPPVMMHWHLYHPAYLAFTFGIGQGVAEILTRWGDTPTWRAVWVAAIAVPVALVYFEVAPATARALELTQRLGVRDFPGRDSIAFLFTPSKAGDVGARIYGEQVLAQLPLNAVLFADWTPYTVLWYLHSVEGVRPDVSVNDLPERESLVATIVRFHGTGRPLYIADTSRYYYTDKLETIFNISPEGAVYRLTQK